MTLGITTRRRARRKWAGLGVTVAMLSLLGASATFANLSGSTFEGDDGNFLHIGSNTDWDNVAGLNTGIDKPSGTTDNAFGQGTKEDGAAVTVVTGSIPPNKNDLTRFYEASEFVGGNNYLYLGWERAVNIGNANLDFEINQNSTAGFSSTTVGAVTLNRTAGDLLITYDFGGSGTPTLGLNFWIVDATHPVITGFATNTCLSANSFPCWGDHIALTSANSEGAVNTIALTDPNNAGASVGIGDFGEAAINLTGAGVFPAGTCEAFGSTFLKSRSSSSFTAEVKDFIAPVAVNISNCGSVLVKKVDSTNSSTLLAGAKFSIVKGAVISGVEQAKSDLVDENTVKTAYAGYYCLDKLKLDTPNVTHHTVTEDAPPPGYQLPATTSQNVTVTSTDTCATRLAKATITPDLTFSDPPNTGAILITKDGKDKRCTGAGAPDTNCSAKGIRLLSGAVFELKQSTTVKYTTAATAADGTVCLDGITLGTYTLHEKTAPTNYSAGADVSVEFKVNSTCAGTPEITKTVVDDPLTTITVSTSSLVGTGATTSTVQCATETTTSDADAGHTTTGLVPGTYTCTVVIDP